MCITDCATVLIKSVSVIMTLFLDCLCVAFCFKGQAIQKAVTWWITSDTEHLCRSWGQLVHFFHAGVSQSLLFSELIMHPFIKKEMLVFCAISKSVVEIARLACIYFQWNSSIYNGKNMEDYFSDRNLLSCVAYIHKGNSIMGNLASKGEELAFGTWVVPLFLFSL